MTNPSKPESCGLGLLCCIALSCIGACKPADETNEKPHAENTQITEVQSAAVRAQGAAEQLAAAAAKRARAKELTSLISTAQGQREALSQRKSKIETQLAGFQADSTATLYKLRVEMQALQKQEGKSAVRSAGQGGSQKTDAFGERARNQVEHALAMDQEYQAQLTQVADELRAIDSSLVAMRTEAALLESEAHRPR